MQAMNLDDEEEPSPSGIQTFGDLPTLVKPSEPTNVEKRLPEIATTEDGAMAEALGNLNLTPEEIRLAVELGNFSQKHFAKNINIIGVSMLTMCIMV